MRNNYQVVIDLTTCEQAILELIHHFSEGFKEGQLLQQVSPIYISGLIQGMILMLENQLHFTGIEPQTYWKSQRGQRLNGSVIKFKNLCREHWLEQPLTPEQLN